MTKEKKSSSFANSLGILIGVVGSFMGIGASVEDPEITTGMGAFFGFVMGYIGGRIAAAVLSLVIQVIIALVGIAIIVFRFANIVEFLTA